MNYRCNHCNVTFPIAPGVEARCPTCLRTNGLDLQPAASASKTAMPASKKTSWALLFALIGLAAAGMWWLKSSEPVDPNAPMAWADIEKELQKLEVPSKGVEPFFRLDNALRDWAKKNAQGNSQTSQVDKLIKVLRALSLEKWQFSEPREEALLPPQLLLAKIQKKSDGKLKLYPLELAWFAALALRAQDVPAKVVEVVAFEPNTEVPDATGHLGYYGVGVLHASGDPTKSSLWDVYGAKTVNKSTARWLTDTQLAGALLNHQALSALSREKNLARALELSTQAIRLDERGACVRSAHGAILMASGNGPEGLKEMMAALELRADAPRHHNVAAVFLGQGDVESALRQVHAALKAQPNFAPAHGTLAAIYMTQGEQESALRELETAEKLDPRWNSLPLLWANYYMSIGQADRAIEKAKQAVAQRAQDVQPRLVLTQLLAQAGRMEEMRTEAQALLQVTPEAARAQIRALLERILGPTVFEQNPTESAPLAEPDLKLNSRLLEEERPKNAEGPALMLGKGDNLRLREPGSELKLNLNASP